MSPLGRLWRALGALGIAAAVLFAGVVAPAGLIWAHTVYPADRAAAIAVFEDPRVDVEVVGRDVVVRPAAGADGTGLVFLPGARVEPMAYAPTLAGVAAAGTVVVIPRVALNLPIADARGVRELAAAAGGDAVQTWAVGGHSLGGVRACQLAAAEPVAVDALVLLGSYCVDDLARSGLRAASVSGGEDGLSDPAAVAAAADRLPADAIRVEIPGANHADFGAYGPQAGDGVSTADADDVRRAVVAAAREAIAGR